MKFSEKIKDLNVKPDKGITYAIDNRKFPLSKNAFFKNKCDVLAYDEYKRCVDLFENRLSDKINTTNLSFMSAGYQKSLSELSQVMHKINVIENTCKDKLILMAERVIREIYNVPDNIEFECFIREVQNQELDSTKKMKLVMSEDDSDEQNTISDERKNVIELEAQKRVILNGLAHGSSIHIWKTAYFIIKDELNDINTELIELYNDYSALVSILLWMLEPKTFENSINDGTAYIQGFNKVKWSLEEEEEEEEEEEDEAFDEEMEEEYQKFLSEMSSNDDDKIIISAVGNNLPVLLHELNKSVIEVLISNSIPKDFSKEELEYYYDIADKYTDEVWHYYLSPTLWVKLLPVINKTEKNIPEIITLFSFLSYNELVRFCDVCVDDTDKAVNVLESMIEYFEI